MPLLWAVVLLLPAFGAGAAVVLTTLHSFNGTNDGANPYAGLVQGSDGEYYGTTAIGGGYAGLYGPGTVFNISTNGVQTSLHSFSGNDGVDPQAALVQGGNGYFYGTTVGGGTNGYGTVFQISTNGFASLYSFTGTNDGSNPQAGLVHGTDGNFYGTTADGGTNGGFGTVFNINTNGELASLYSFSGTNDGADPNGGLVQGSDGNFYGTTHGGGTNNKGTVFQIGANGAFTSLYSFSGTNDGSNPEAALVQGSDGNFYGTTYGGGTNGLGTVFRLTIMPEFQAVSLTNGVLRLTYATETGGTYQLQYNYHPDFSASSSNWVNQGAVVIATGATFSFTDFDTQRPQKLYRVKLLLP